MAEAKYEARLKTLYDKEIRKALKEELGLANINQVPKLEKVIVSSGTGKKREDKRYTETVALTISKITGQAVTSRLAKKSIAQFKIRKGMGVPRKSFDANGNYSLGLKEQTVFPEISFEDSAVLHGIEITFVIKNGSKEASTKLLEKFGMPFEKENK